jgi:hypothetical protein
VTRCIEVLPWIVFGAIMATGISFGGARFEQIQPSSNFPLRKVGAPDSRLSTCASCGRVTYSPCVYSLLLQRVEFVLYYNKSTMPSSSVATSFGGQDMVFTAVPRLTVVASSSTCQTLLPLIHESARIVRLVHSMFSCV